MAVESRPQFYRNGNDKEVIELTGYLIETEFNTNAAHGQDHIANMFP